MVERSPFRCGRFGRWVRCFEARSALCGGRVHEVDGEVGMKCGQCGGSGLTMQFGVACPICRGCGWVCDTCRSPECDCVCSEGYIDATEHDDDQ